MSRFEEVKNLISGLEDDFHKFYDKGNKAAGTRVRNGMNEAKKLAQEIRKEITDIKNSGK
ncbi:histone H1 [Litoribacter ruber]|uniref:Histone H1 n=1 Tax=Litoribacter ruber TaxID=702568 RepID=A0AAP2CF10_9BACT|nr:MULTISPECIES: histone H1 [Litoribacter]MBS9523263.1 histone H1 [Litoribacter alkaliphilus]MBT0810574.1 histone H1 [Litoribacter ruber]